MRVKSCFIKIFILVLCSFKSVAQNENLADDSKFHKKTFFYENRGTNVFEVGIGASIINGDLPDPMFEIASRFGYKRYISPHLNIGLAYSKFNLAFKDTYNEGFMSFDLNFEYLMSPYRKFSPFLFAGGGYNASNYFDQTATKLQGGVGLEIIAAKKFGLKLMADYNYVFSDTLDGLEFGDSDDAYWRILFGINLYFGGNKTKERVLKDFPTVIKSNPIIGEN